ncbi:MAG: PqqD family protein [Planctomycetota bacterium]
MSSHDDRDNRPVRTPAALWRVLDGCAVIFHEETGRAFALNGTATRIWEMCDGGVTLGALVDSLAGASADEREAPRESVERLLKQLADEGFVEMKEAVEEGRTPSPVEELPAEGAEGEWTPPVAEEIRFAACDCTGAAYGNLRNLECLLVSPGQSS